MKMLSFEYDASYDPPAPVVDAEVDGYVESLGTLTISAMIDSGADATVLPAKILDAVGADYMDSAWMRGAAGGRIEVDLYLVGIRIGTNMIDGIHAIGSSAPNEAIIGRDVLNRLILTLNGHAEMTEIVIESP